MAHPKIFPLLLLLTVSVGAEAAALEQRSDTSFLRGPYNGAFFHRENGAYRIGAAIHYAHSIEHDILQLEPLSDHAATDETPSPERTTPPRRRPGRQ